MARNNNSEKLLTRETREKGAKNNYENNTKINCLNSIQDGRLMTFKQ